MKKIVYLIMILLIIMVLSLTACTSKKTNDEIAPIMDNTKPDEKIEETEKADKEVEDESEEIVILLNNDFTLDDLNLDILNDEQIASLQAYLDGEIELMTAINSDLFSKEEVLDSGLGTEMPMNAYEDMISDNTKINAFTAVSIEGETITEEYFKTHDLTFLHLWATWCPPCVKEMPNLGELERELRDEVGFLAVVSDADTKKELAIEILTDSKAEFLNVMPNDVLLGLLASTGAIPTTALIDKDGYMVGDFIIGSRSTEEYKELIEKALAKVRE